MEVHGTLAPQSSSHTMTFASKTKINHKKLIVNTVAKSQLHKYRLKTKTKTKQWRSTMLTIAANLHDIALNRE